MTADYFEAGFLALKGDVMAVVDPIKQAANIGQPVPDPANPPKPLHAARKIQQVAGAVSAALGLPLQLMNTGFALATNAISACCRRFRLPPWECLFTARDGRVLAGRGARPMWVKAHCVRSKFEGGRFGPFHPFRLLSLNIGVAGGTHRAT